MVGTVDGDLELGRVLEHHFFIGADVMMEYRTIRHKSFIAQYEEQLFNL